MDAAFDRVLARYHERMAQEAEVMRREGPAAAARRDSFLLPVGEAAGRLLHALAVGRGAVRALELGTSYGYSTLFLADAMRATGGLLTTLEIAPEKQAAARETLAQAGLADRVDWRTGDAVALLDALPGPFDFVLIDLWKELYLPCLERLVPRLADAAVVVADNMLHPPEHHEEARAYRAAIQARPQFTSTLLPIGAGLELSTFWRAAPPVSRADAPSSLRSCR